MTMWVLDQWQKSSNIVGHEADWANWALEHIFFDDVKAFDLAGVQPELRTFLKAFDDPVFCTGLKPHWAKHLDNLRLIARASMPELVVDFEQMQHDLTALKEAESMSAKASAERDEMLRSSLSEIESSVHQQAEEQQKENERLRQRVEELQEKNKQLQQLECALSDENALLREQLTKFAKVTSVLSERCAALERQTRTVASCIAPVLLPYKATRYLKNNGMKKFFHRVWEELKH